jgi:hypothetical protein
MPRSLSDGGLVVWNFVEGFEARKVVPYCIRDAFGPLISDLQLCAQEQQLTDIEDFGQREKLVICFRNRPTCCNAVADGIFALDFWSQFYRFVITHGRCCFYEIGVYPSAILL